MCPDLLIKIVRIHFGLLNEKIYPTFLANKKPILSFVY